MTIGASEKQGFCCSFLATTNKPTRWCNRSWFMYSVENSSVIYLWQKPMELGPTGRDHLRRVSQQLVIVYRTPKTFSSFEVFLTDLYFECKTLQLIINLRLIELKMVRYSVFWADRQRHCQLDISLREISPTVWIHAGLKTSTDQFCIPICNRSAARSSHHERRKVLFQHALIMQKFLLRLWYKFRSRARQITDECASSNESAFLSSCQLNRISASAIDKRGPEIMVIFLSISIFNEVRLGRPTRCTSLQNTRSEHTSAPIFFQSFLMRWSNSNVLMRRSLLLHRLEWKHFPPTWYLIEISP